VVLVHRVANARPKRFLVADEVGLGKTIEAISYFANSLNG
jgi:hypothetical protein